MGEMKAGSRFLNAVSAVALSASVVASGAGVITIISAGAAEAAVIQRIDVRGASRVGAEAVRSNLTIAPGKSFGAGRNGLGALKMRERRDNNIGRLFCEGRKCLCEQCHN